MELMEAINCRHSVRSYKPDSVEREKIEAILDAAVKAPSGMNNQPWAFGIIQDRTRLEGYNRSIKERLLNSFDAMPWLKQYEEHFRDPNYDVFYGAPTLLVIYAKDPSPLSMIDCCLAAENSLLAACDLGLGTCWIGFAIDFLNQPETKQELGVPAEYATVAPIIVGYPQGEIPVREKNPPDVIYWKQ